MPKYFMLKIFHFNLKQTYCRCLAAVRGKKHSQAAMKKMMNGPLDQSITNLCVVS